MHRAGGRILRSRQVFGQVRRNASTATKPKTYDEMQPSGTETRSNTWNAFSSASSDAAPGSGSRSVYRGSKSVDSTRPYTAPRNGGNVRRENNPHLNRHNSPQGPPSGQQQAPRSQNTSWSRSSLNQRDTGRQWNDTSRQEGSSTRPQQHRSFVEPELATDPEVNATRNSKMRREKFKDRSSLFVEHPTQPVNQPPARRPVDTKQTPTKARNHAPKYVRRPMLQVYIPTTVTVGALATILKVKLARLQKRIVDLGLTDRPNYDYRLTADYAALLAEEFNRKPIVDDEAAFDLFPPAPCSNSSSLPHRPPVVTIMGHVDHGKTTLLDTLRSSSVAKGEAGGITQHIGAFSVPVTPAEAESSGPKSITFLDTPGHAAFSAMRARGAGVTDIIVLVVAADDGIMPQTREVIELHKKCQDTVGLVVAINKVDKPGADVGAVEKALMAEGIQLESYGGDIPAVHVSGLTGQGLSDLVETLSAMAEMQDLRAEQEGFAFGEILESRVQKGLGFIATALVLRGTLKPGAHIVSGSNYAKVRIMADSTGAAVKAATPGMAVTVSGWKTLPKAGDNVIEGSESNVKKALTNRIRQSEIEACLADVDAINETRKVEREIREKEALEAARTKGRARPITRNQPSATEEPSGPKQLRLIIKADVSGSAEAAEGALQDIGNKVAISKVLQTGVGDVTETDVMLAKTANATIVAFSVGVPRSIQALAAQNGVPISESKIIYKLMDDVRDRVRAMLPPIIETKVIGEAGVLQIFDYHMKDKSIKKIAGCRVTNGLLDKSKHAKVVREGKTVHEGTLETMRHLKKDVTEARKGTECGLSLTDFSDLREGDLIQVLEKIERPGLL
ncbi:translation initiation factor IF-2 [Ephemerocybe angulata]|uniref:Translation initiation factor IF-2 n=1 Tax=Ephemerocybe angulata TaxID=980116 RepID=A0A8H6IG93_9AGAR|nr:translation initiation factor IF-2 [Tulosesus angulatus]